MPRVLSDRLQATATLDGDPYGSRNRSTSDLQPLLPLKCEVGAHGLWWLPPPGFLAPAQPSGHLQESKHLTSGHQAGTPEEAPSLFSFSTCEIEAVPLSNPFSSSDVWWGIHCCRPGWLRLGTASDLGVPSQLLHVAIVCAGHNSSREVITLVKSVLFYRYRQAPWTRVRSPPTTKQSTPLFCFLIPGN